MNNTLQDFAREQLLIGLSQLPEGWVTRFKQMYGRDNGRRTLADTEAMDIREVVFQMPEDKLDWAMQQVSNSLAKLVKKEA